MAADADGYRSSLPSRLRLASSSGRPHADPHLAIVRLRAGAFDGALAALEPAFALPAEQRITDLTTRLSQVRGELAAPIFRGSPQARELGDQIEEFSRTAVTTGLHALSG